MALASGCATIDRQQARTATAYDVMTDDEIARAGVREALGELHEVLTIDAETSVVTAGRSAFQSREERLIFERRIDALVRGRVYGQGPTMELLRIHCEALQRSGWAGWPGDRARLHRACDYGDADVTLHSLFRKPMLQRAYVDLLLAVIGDDAFSTASRERLTRLAEQPLEPYSFVVGAWERVEGFRPRS